MGPFVLLHVVFAGEGFVAVGADDVFLPGMLFAVAGGVAGGGKFVGAIVQFGVGARVFLSDRQGVGEIGGGTVAGCSGGALCG